MFEKSKDYNDFFTMIQLVTGIKLYERNSVIIFDEVQKYVKARKMIKHFIIDGRYDFIETGSLITLKKIQGKF